MTLNVIYLTKQLIYTLLGNTLCHDPSHTPQWTTAVYKHCVLYIALSPKLHKSYKKCLRVKFLQIPVPHYLHCRSKSQMYTVIFCSCSYYCHYVLNYFRLLQVPCSPRLSVFFCLMCLTLWAVLLHTGSQWVSSCIYLLYADMCGISSRLATIAWCCLAPVFWDWCLCHSSFSVISIPENTLCLTLISTQLYLYPSSDWPMATLGPLLWSVHLSEYSIESSFFTLHYSGTSV